MCTWPESPERIQQISNRESCRAQNTDPSAVLHLNPPWISTRIPCLSQMWIYFSMSYFSLEPQAYRTHLMHSVNLAKIVSEKWRREQGWDTWCSWGKTLHHTVNATYGEASTREEVIFLCFHNIPLVVESVFSIEWLFFQYITLSFSNF